MITPETLREWAAAADEGEDVALDGDTLREIAEQLEYGQDTAKALSEALERL